MSDACANCQKGDCANCTRQQRINDPCCLEIQAFQGGGLSHHAEWPACTMQQCGSDTYGPYHGPECARSKFAADNLSLFWD